MIKLIESGELDLDMLRQRSGFDVPREVEDTVREIISRVTEAGDEALFDYTERFDGVRLSELRVTKREMEQALDELDPKLLEVLRLAAENIRAFHRHQLQNGFMLTERAGVMLGQRVTAIERVGLYVPGGTASYPSTVLMDAIPAKLAGVPELCICTPPDKDGRVASAILAAAQIAGVDTVYKVGGAQAVAAMAYGTESIDRVYKIMGPGNIYVAAAKRQVYGQVDIDMIAGPSDVLILADDSANPRLVAADMLAQAEHDVLASAILVTDSRDLAEAVSVQLESQLKLLPREEIARRAIEDNSMIVIAGDMTEGAELVNLIAPEHLEIMTREPEALLGLVRNAGSIFLGEHSVEALGDYLAGPNHTLPTMGTARFSSPLSVDDFTKKCSITYFSRDALRNVADDIALFARSEGLEGHARSAELRFEEEE